MSRSPLFYPLNRGMDTEAGGVSDLQTDVMRFMAILALCLVAIFALVQSIPLLPTVVDPQPEPAVETSPVEHVPEPAKPEPAVIKPAPPQQKPMEVKPLVITRPAPVRVERPPRQVVQETTLPPAIEPLEPPVSVPSTRTEGFTLRFETDLALTRLVARNEVGLYAITPDKSLRMNVNRAQLSFWPASIPNQFHEMDEATVPEEVLAALRRAGSVNKNDVKWGVTLPMNMRRQLDEYLRQHSGGSLIIGGDGDLRLEH